MDIALLQTFAAVARAGSFAAHARDRGVDPSSVSRAVAALEEEIGVRLFDRTTRRLAPTEAGRLYLARIAPLLAELDSAADAARDAVTEPSGLLRVTASVTFAERWLMPRVASFRAAHPRIELELALTDAVLDLVAEGIDLGIRLGPAVTGPLVVSKLFDTRYRVVASPAYLARAGHPARPSELADHDGIAFALPGLHSIWRFRRRGEEVAEEVTPGAALSVSNALAIRRAALDGLGCALLADWTIAGDLKDGSLVDLFPDHEASASAFGTAAWIVYPSRNYVPARVRAFIDHLRRSR